MRKICYIVSVLLIGLAAQANVIYQDDFSGLQTDPLNGTAPDTRPGSETLWTASVSAPLDAADPRADGSFGENVSRTAYLPIEIESNKIYTFKIDLTIDNPSSTDRRKNDWMALSLNNKPSNPQNSPYQPASIATLLLRRNGGAQAITRSGSGTVSSDEGTYNADKSNELKFVLDTTEAQWTIDFFINGKPVAADRNTAPSLSAGTYYVAIGKFASGQGKFDNLSVTVMSKPATLGLFSMATVGMLFSRRLRF